MCRSSGQVAAGDPDAVQAVMRTWYGNHPDETRAATGMFGPAKPAPDDAPDLDPPAAYVGRTVYPSRTTT
ncbi:hypothetical protein [Streptomyces sp. NPDC059918]|uniref:hypothetical protein n=1 Tax=unclassified Streptomyces TaxID=2593676 RepID=UPI00364F57CF